MDDLLPGTICPCDFVDDQGLLLIAEGVEITQSLLDNLRARGVTSLRPRSGVAKRRPRRTRSAESYRVDPNDVISTTYQASRVQRIKRQFLAGEYALQRLTDSFDRDRVTDLRETDPHVEAYITELAQDPDPIVANALRRSADIALARRCVSFSILSLAIAQQMRLSNAEMRDIGSAALIHDWGLFRLPEDARFPHQIRDSVSRANYVRHPLVTEVMLQYVAGVSPAVKRMVTQVHELLDGSGFPKGIQADEILLGSRVLSIADAYLTMTVPPAGSVRVVPCDAIAYLISAASQGRYSASALTGLLKAVTLYPIGSLVELSDSTQARVIRSNGNDYGYPIVETLARPSRVLNLKQSELFVAGPVITPEAKEVRLPETYSDLNEAFAVG